MTMYPENMGEMRYVKDQGLCGFIGIDIYHGQTTVHVRRISDNFKTYIWPELWVEGKKIKGANP